MSLRVGVVAACPYPVPQGSQVYIEQTVRALMLAGHDASLICYGYGTGETPDDIDIQRAPRVPLASRTAAGPSLAKPLQDWLLARTLRQTSARWDALLAHNYEGLLAALWSGIRPVAYAPHNALVDELPHYFGGAGWAASLGARIDLRLPRRADAIVALHQRLADYLVDCGCDRDRIVVSPPAAPLQDFTGEAPAESMPFVLYTGNLDHYQNIGLLQAAMARVNQARPSVPLFAVTHARAGLRGAVTVSAAGFNTAAELLKKDAILAAPRVSWSGYPIKLLNALAAGRPSVVCESAKGPVVHEYSGLVVPDNDVEAFALALLKLLNDDSLRLRLGENARRTAVQQHGLSNLASSLDAALTIARARSRTSSTGPCDSRKR